MKEDETECQSSADSDADAGKCGIIIEQSTAVQAGAELSVTSSSGVTSGGICLSSLPDPESTNCTYNSSDRDDTITDEDIEFFLGEKTTTTYVAPSCSHLSTVQPVPESGIDITSPCAQCGSRGENWICLICYQVYCSRYVNKHMLAHTQETSHPITLSFIDVTVWCYGCDDYVYNDVLEPARKIVMDAKYGSPTDKL